MITFSASSADLLLAAAGSISAVAVLAALEWRRSNRRHLVWRVGASGLAVFALTLLGLQPSWHSRREKAKPASEIAAAVWTPGAVDTAATPDVASRYRFVLPGTATVPPRATAIPDIATLRRRFPEITTLDVFGAGLNSGDLEALRGCRVVFHPPVSDRPVSPGIRFLRFPRTLPLGEALIIEGEVGGLPPGARPLLSLEGPDGTGAETVASPADNHGCADFTLHANPPEACGRFLWRLQLLSLGAKGSAPAEAESVGVAIVPPLLPRVLVLESSPHFDTADLRRWFAGAGGRLTSRTLVGQDRYRFASSGAEPAPQFAVVDARLLAGFDLLLADSVSLAALAAPERDALLAAVTDTGLGVLTHADETSPPIPPTRSLFPWQLIPTDDAGQEGGEHLARPDWVGQVQPIGTPIPTAPLLLAPIAGQSVLIRDGQGRTLAAALARGRGQMGLTLLRDSGRWLRANDAASFGAYWSFLFSRLARPLDDGPEAGRWTSAESDDGPVFAGEPLTLVWSGATSPNPFAQVLAASGSVEDSATLALARDPVEPNQWRGTFWPRHAGWYRVAAPDGGAGSPLDFNVDAATSWPTLAAERKRLATQRFAQSSQSAAALASPPMPAKGNTTIPAVCFFAIFLGGAGYVWTERRLTR